MNGYDKKSNKVNFCISFFKIINQQSMKIYHQNTFFNGVYRRPRKRDLIPPNFKISTLF